MTCTTIKAHSIANNVLHGIVPVLQLNLNHFTWFEQLNTVTITTVTVMAWCQWWWWWCCGQHFINGQLVARWDVKCERSHLTLLLLLTNNNCIQQLSRKELWLHMIIDCLWGWWVWCLMSKLDVLMLENVIPELIQWCFERFEWWWWCGLVVVRWCWLAVNEWWWWRWWCVDNDRVQYGEVIRAIDIVWEVKEIHLTKEHVVCKHEQEWWINGCQCQRLMIDCE